MSRPTLLALTRWPGSLPLPNRGRRLQPTARFLLAVVLAVIVGAGTGCDRDDAGSDTARADVAEMTDADMTDAETQTTDTSDPFLTTDRSSYVAEAEGDGGERQQFAFSVIARYHNERADTLYLEPCGADTTVPIFLVEGRNGESSAYGPVWACAGMGQRIAVAPDAERRDTLRLRGPTVWRDDGAPIGRLSGQFHLRYTVYTCPEGPDCVAPASLSRSPAFAVKRSP